LLKIGLKVAPESISEGLFFKNFQGGGMPPAPPRRLPCFTCRTHPYNQGTISFAHFLPHAADGLYTLKLLPTPLGVRWVMAAQANCLDL